MICNICKNEIYYDEGLGNLGDGYVCFECMSNGKVICGSIERGEIKIQNDY